MMEQDKEFGESLNTSINSINSNMAFSPASSVSSSSPKKKRKKIPKRLSDQPHPGYQYAVSEYHQTVQPSRSNDDGRSFDEDDEESNQQIAQHYEFNPIRQSGWNSQQQQHHHHHHQSQQQLQHPMPPIRESASQYSDYIQNVVSDVVSYEPTTIDQPIVGETATAAAASSRVHQEVSSYEEQYGDAYIGSPLKYIYPNGYQSMRPRGGPWKLSIAICVLFTWLSIFIVGHCSDRVDQSIYTREIDDDALVIETRWCGSRLLYFMWVMSMLITCLAAAYCSVIGYIKVRDFAVANSRSQPPGIAKKSDYYVRIEDASQPQQQQPPGASGNSGRFYQRTIYQADGTPQFWGDHIYRPTQAAVAVTSR